jgi:nucleotide-binding universal stress UspA family protein
VFRDILVAVDGSAHADRALEEAIDLARLSGGSLTLVTVAPELSTWFLAAGAGLPPAVDLAQLREDLIREYRQMLEQAEARVPDGVGSTALVLQGRVGEAIVRQARAGGHDLVAMGSRGRGELRSMVLGSVSHQVLHDSPVPVLIVHLKEDQRERPISSSH